MRWFIAALAFVTFVFCNVVEGKSQTAGFLGAQSPYDLQVNFGEPDGTTVPSPPGYANAASRTYVTLSSLAGTTAVIVVVGQSLAESASLGTYSTSNSTSLNFSIYDRGVYQCANPALGTPLVSSLAPSGNSFLCQLADNLINAGTYSNVIIASAAIGGTTCANWNTGGVINQRISALYAGLAARKLTPASGFSGEIYILWHDGETDNVNGTSQASLTTCLRQVAGIFSSIGFSTTRFFIATESIAGNAASSAVTGAQAAAVASGCSTCRAGMNVDSFTGPTYRQTDGTHPTAALAAAMASGDTTIITNCHNAGNSC
jgi:hypothetical protein